MIDPGAPLCPVCGNILDVDNLMGGVTWVCAKGRAEGKNPPWSEHYLRSVITFTPEASRKLVERRHALVEMEARRMWAEQPHPEGWKHVPDTDVDITPGTGYLTSKAHWIAKARRKWWLD